MIIGSEIIFIKNISSTNTHASKLLYNGPAPSEGTIFYTNYQSAGKGQMGNRWESEDGKNLLFSLILFPDLILPEDQFIISMAVSLGICDFLSEVVPDCKIKWPNDIYIRNDKIAGVLIENAINGNRIESSVIGIGLNINQTTFIGDAPNPVSLKMITGKDYDTEICLKLLAGCLDQRYKQLLSGKNDEISDRYISLLYRLNEWHRFSTGSRIFSGKIVSVTHNGHLLVEDENSTILEFSLKEISFVL
jgi:BirA family biotin operon repressor/biotin-[acetyl-CoA-carboxylase] ligase